MYMQHFTLKSFREKWVFSCSFKKNSKCTEINPRNDSIIQTNFNYTFLRTICVQYLRILLSSFGEEDFQRFTSNFNSMFKLSLASISPIM